MLDLCSFGKSTTLLQSGDDLLDSQVLKGSLVFVEKVVDPCVGQVRESFAFSRFNVPVVVEDCNFIAIWNLLVLNNELFQIFASLE